MSTPHDDHDKSSYEIAYRKIGSVLDRLHDKNICPACTAQALALHAAAFAEFALGSAEAIQALEGVIGILRKHGTVPGGGPSSEIH